MQVERWVGNSGEGNMVMKQWNRKGTDWLGKTQGWVDKADARQVWRETQRRDTETNRQRNSQH